MRNYLSLCLGGPFLGHTLYIFLFTYREVFTPFVGESLKYKHVPEKSEEAS